MLHYQKGSKYSGIARLSTIANGLQVCSDFIVRQEIKAEVAPGCFVYEGYLTIETEMEVTELAAP